ncbi:MAG TPA: peptidylprolyl isomerase [Candidatus Goldiibacteriota bacterium]|nr:peptidylprolyl isomerase [Candidatus Goldiibacteriota bacterium]
MFVKKKRLKYFYFIVFLCLFFSCDANKNVILATVDGYKIYKKEFVYKSVLYGIGIDNEADAQNFINLLINDYLILKQAKRDKIRLSNDEFLREIENFVPNFSEKEIKKQLNQQGIKYKYWIKDIKEKIIRKKELNNVMKENIEIKESDLKDYFWTNILEFRNPKKIKARQIVLNDETKAKEVIGYVREGMDFAELARKYSTTSEAEAGGDLGYFSKNELPSFITDVVFNLKEGETSGIVKSPYGWHIFKCEEIINAKTPKFEEVKDEVYVKYFEQKKDEYIQTWLEDLRKNSKIEIYYDNIKLLVQEANK